MSPIISLVILSSSGKKSRYPRIALFVEFVLGGVADKPVGLAHRCLQNVPKRRSGTSRSGTQACRRRRVEAERGSKHKGWLSLNAE